MTYVVVERNILGFHVYTDVWTPVTGEVLICELEDEYLFEPSGASVIYWMQPHLVNALLIEFCVSISFTDRFDKVPLA